MKRLIHKFTSSAFAMNSLKLMAGTTFAQFVSILMAPILYRIYSKEAYGVLGLFIAISGVIGVFSTMQYNQVILVVKEDCEAHHAETLNRLINAVIALLIIPLIFFTGSILSESLNSPQLEYWLYFLPVYIFFAGQNEIFRVKANRLRKYSALSYNTIINSIFTPLLSLTLAFAFVGPGGLIIAFIAGQIVSTIYLQIKIGSTIFSKKSERNFKEVKRLAKTHIKYPLFVLPSELINRFSRQLPVFFLGSVGGEASVGVYNLCTRMLNLPVSLITGALSEVFKQKASAEYHTLGNCLNIFKKTGKLLLLIGIVPLTILMIFGPQLFSLVFGAKWMEAGQFAQIFAPMFLLQLIVSPLTFVYFIRNKLSEDFILHLLLLFSLLGLFYFLSNRADIHLTMIYFSALHCLLYIVYFIRSYQLSK